MQIPDDQLQRIKALPGLLATVVTTGAVDSWFSKCHEDMRAWNITNGFTNVEYMQIDAKLVEAGRDQAIAHMMNTKTTNGTPYAWCLQIDADATFAPDSAFRILHTAYNMVPDSDAVGAYSQLKGPVGLPTIDCGSGTWEIHYPGEGILPVIRTGAHFILTKQSAFEKLGNPPWFRTRHAPRALDVMADMDNIARCKLSGRNPFSETPEWQTLLEHASKGSQGGPSSVGEDSGFCDRLKSCGGRIYVDTAIVTGHVTREVITPARLIEFVRKRNQHLRLSCGVTE